MSEGVVVTCGSCGSKLRVKAGADGRTGKCPKCGVRIQIQLPTETKSSAVAKREAAIEPTAVVAKREDVIEKPAATVKREEAIEPAPEISNRVETIEKPSEQTPAPGTFLFFSANGAEAEVRVAPKAVAMTQTANAAVLKIGLTALAAMLVGAAAMVTMQKWGGTEYWVVKRSIVAWMAGMFAAFAIMSVAVERTSQVRLLAATFAATSVVAAWLYNWPAGFSPIDLLLMALAIAGSGTAFILAETTPGKRVDVMPATVRVLR